jgi:hypothetical protein
MGHKNNNTQFSERHHGFVVWTASWLCSVNDTWLVLWSKFNRTRARPLDGERRKYMYGKWLKNIFKGQNDAHPMGQTNISTDLDLKQTCIMKKKKKKCIFHGVDMNLRSHKIIYKTCTCKEGCTLYSKKNWNGVFVAFVL